MRKDVTDCDILRLPPDSEGTICALSSDHFAFFIWRIERWGDSGGRLAFSLLWWGNGAGKKTHGRGGFVCCVGDGFGGAAVQAVGEPVGGGLPDGVVGVPGLRGGPFVELGSRVAGTAWVAVRNLDLATPITGMPNSACACAPRPGRPPGSRSA